ncbi:hypothetical protein M427DRAFT_28176 [Gonapodya prolifera JEL478]|uniref:Jacalin-type lectin domain-containing protein n=1 Tax=Gonapodya prolifera (strain JEL478) TaxID=1344416 RepID=A0A139AUN5_GONPJ|nr:hypothetical protein M427DRAFT_28176 [Gonapodya prolifera JEL478]|eukprot:KXS20456.1 hypothetical protein M427DRAFT_28176 [Gonapodya prolifera JEL478]
MPVRFLNIVDRECVYQRLILLHGVIEPWLDADPGADANVGAANPLPIPLPTPHTISCVNASLPKTHEERAFKFPVVGGLFKALVWLVEGKNAIHFDFAPPHNSSQQPAKALLTLSMEIPRENPPLNLSILAASDSEMKFDLPHWCRQGERASRNGYVESERRHRFNAYLWQAFTAEAMYRAGYGRRTFRLDEENCRDPFQPPVHLLRSRYPLSTLRIPNLAQQRAEGMRNADGGDLPESLFDAAFQALDAAAEEHRREAGAVTVAPTTTHAPAPTSTIAPGRSGAGAPDTVRPAPAATPRRTFPTSDFPTSYHSCLLLDSMHVPPSTILGHTALGGGTGETRLGVFGSHLVHSYPSRVSEVAECAWDARPLGGTADDNGECKERWRAWGIGSGATLHEAGHGFGLGHSGEGIMARGYNDFARAFAPYARAVPRSEWPVTAAKEGGMKWARVDLVRFRGSECFALPTDTVRPPAFASAPVPSLYPLPEPYTFIAVCSSGLLLANYTHTSNEAYVCHDEFSFAPTPPTTAVLDFRLPLSAVSSQWNQGGQPRPDLTLELVGVGGGNVHVRDIAASYDRALVRPAAHGLPARFRSSPVGMGGGEEFVLTWGRERRADGTVVHRAVSELRAHGGLFLDGLEVVVEEWTDGGAGPPSVVVHRLASPVHAQPSVLVLGPGDGLGKFKCHAGAWLDGLACVTEAGREADWAGGRGGRAVEVGPPPGSKVVGVWGTKGEQGWVTSFGVVYERDE